MGKIKLILTYSICLFVEKIICNIISFSTLHRKLRAKYINSCTDSIYNEMNLWFDIKDVCLHLFHFRTKSETPVRNVRDIPTQPFGDADENNANIEIAPANNMQNDNRLRYDKRRVLTALVGDSYIVFLNIVV